MINLNTRHALLGLFVLLLVCRNVRGQEPVSIDYEVSGSEPPPQLWQTCLRDFGRKWRTEQEAQGCLEQILASRYFTAGIVEKLKDNSSQWKLNFVLKAPALILKEVELGVGDRDGEELRAWLSRRHSLLSVGDTYSWSSQRRMTIDIQEWYRSSGQKVGISTNEHLDYRDRTARLIYSIVHGPGVAPEPLVAQSSEDCDQMVVSFNQTGIGDLVPLALVNGLNRTRGASCFRREWIDEDLKRLRATGLFSNVEYQVKESNREVSVNLTVKGKPLRVKGVSVRSFGIIPAQTSSAQTKLLLAAGNEYRQSKVRASCDLLEKYFARKGLRVEVFEVVEVASASEVTIQFNVLQYEEDKIFVDGRLINVNPPEVTNGMVVSH